MATMSVDDIVSLFSLPVVRQAVASSLLDDPAVKQELLSSIDVKAALAEPSVKQELIASLDIASALADPAIKQELVASLDLETMLQSPAVKRELIASIDLETVLSDPEVVRQLRQGLLASAPETARGLSQQLAEDATSRDAFHHALLSCGLGAGLLLGVYVLVVAACALTLLTFGAYLTCFVTTVVFQFAWVHIFQIPRALLAVFALRRLPKAGVLLEAAVVAASAPPPHTSAAVDPASAASALVVRKLTELVLPPLAPLLGPLGLCCALCAWMDFVGMSCVVVLCWRASVAEQLPLSALMGATIGFTLLDLVPLLTWPLLRWALPVATCNAITSGIAHSVDAAVTSFIAKPSADGGDGAGGAGGASGEGMRKPMLASVEEGNPFPPATAPQTSAGACGGAHFDAPPAAMIGTTDARPPPRQSVAARQALRRDEPEPAQHETQRF